MNSTDRRTPPTRQERHTVELTRTEALALLGEVSLGRVVFTQRALPAVRPVDHLLDGDDIVVRTYDSSALRGQARPHGAVVAYQADALDPVTHLGWSVVVTGYCRPVTGPADLARYARLLQPWPRLPGQVMDSAVRIGPHPVSGVRLVAAG
ncbi:pyridoxamine 5'-phosphate oxidase family protein [Streptomyces albidoflavus]|uniref:pyridoxamine 5'-phosphate oxidase family protein n=1 Tax=Streptomyces albidoflavus TaxID=1886 RepID=UPI000FF4488D|nr:pyridoxamine 5'-phosphate oxidase family protein [Streptomyces albidoflavus]RWZ72775.1 pyridoxamine 5'-phosphate oxidase family protein [Streptomyces albidoflavus]